LLNDVSQRHRHIAIRSVAVLKFPNRVDPVNRGGIDVIFVKGRVEHVVKISNDADCNGNRKSENIDENNSLFFARLRKVISK